jgi:deazaflavin-dependent oxidoreductase (nitroreductase family)
MMGPDELNCLCYWTGEPGQSWRAHAWKSLHAKIHRYRHQRHRPNTGDVRGVSSQDMDGDIEASDSPAGSAGVRPVRNYQPGRWHGLENSVMSALVRAGLVPHSSLLITRGRRTGRSRKNPVVVVAQDGRQWLVAPYGAVSWVHNARAAGQVGLARRRHTRVYAVREVMGAEAGPVLQAYVTIASATRPYFQADQNDPVERFIAEATQHPVFELTPIGPDSPLSAWSGTGTREPPA